MSWLDSLIFGVRRIFVGGVEQPTTDTLDFIGATASYDQANRRLSLELPGGVGANRKIIAGHGLSGGGSLAFDRTLSVQSSDFTINVDSEGIRLATIDDQRHGARGAWYGDPEGEGEDAPVPQHPLATDEAPGFMSAAQVEQLELFTAAQRAVVVDYMVTDDFEAEADYTVISPTELEGIGEDSFPVPAGTRILFAAQPALPEHGWYEVTQASAPWLMTRLPGLDTSEGIQDRTVTVVRPDTDSDPNAQGRLVILADPQWPGGTLGTDTLSFELVLAGGDPASYSATPKTLAKRDANGALRATRVELGAVGETLPSGGLVRLGVGSKWITARNAADTADIDIIARSGNNVIINGNYAGNVTIHGDEEFAYKRRTDYIIKADGGSITFYKRIYIYSSATMNIEVSGSAAVGSPLRIIGQQGTAGKGGDVRLQPGIGTTTHGVVEACYGSTTKFVTAATGIDVAGVVTTPPNQIAISTTGTTTLDCSLSEVHVITVTAATCTLALSNTRAGARYEFHIQAAAGSCTVTLSPTWFDGVESSDVDDVTNSSGPGITDAILVGTCLVDGGPVRICTRKVLA